MGSFERIAGICGIAAPVVALSMIGLALSQASWFSWTGNALSDLGVGDTAMIFNFGLILGGILAAVLAFGLSTSLLRDLIGRVGSAAFLSATLALICIGIFPENAGKIHYVVSVAFFVMVPISMIVLGVALVRSDRKGDRLHASLIIILAIIASLAWVLPHDGVAIPEIISSVAGAIFIGIFGFRMLYGNPSSQTYPG